VSGSCSSGVSPEGCCCLIGGVTKPGDLVAVCSCGRNCSIFLCLGLTRGCNDSESAELVLGLRSGLVGGRSSGLWAGLPLPRFSDWPSEVSCCEVRLLPGLILPAGCFTSSSSSLSLSKRCSVSIRVCSAGAEWPPEPRDFSRLSPELIRLLRVLTAVRGVRADAGANDDCCSWEC